MKINSKKSVVLTGSSGFLGSVITQTLVDNHWHVIAIDTQKPNHIPENVSFIQFDLMDINAYNQLKQIIRSTSQNIKALINNAAANPSIEGDISTFGKFEDMNLNEWNKDISLNLSAPVFLIQNLLDIFNHSDTKPCKIVNVISTYGIVPPNQDIYKPLSKAKGIEIYKPIAYSVTKAGLAMATKYLSVYLAQKGFNVNGIAPGGIENNQPREFVHMYSKYTPMGRMAQREEMMDIILLLLDKGSDYMNGQIIAVDGGWTVW